jgi:hypothetical protein
VFLRASLQAEQLDLDYDAELLYVGAMFHDVGLLEGHRSEHERFEIDGGERRPSVPRAARPARGAGHDRLAIDRAAHDEAGAELPEARGAAGALGVQYDVLGSHFDTLTADQRDAVLAAHPRTRLETGMIEVLSAGVREKPDTAVGTMMTDILEATVRGYMRPNVCDAIQNSRFET